MASIVVCGGSVIGLATAMLLARDGHEVTVLERDAAPPPDEPARAWDGWERNGVAQFHQPHNLFPRFRHILEAELPGVVDRLLAAGCVWIDPLEWMPPFIHDRAPRPGDDRFPFVTGRRPVVESVLARAADETAGVTVRRGVRVTGLLTGTDVVDGVPHVVGVGSQEGERLQADLVVDAMGRRSRLGEWLVAAGGRAPHTEAEDCGFAYYTRYFSGPRLPAVMGPPLAEIGTFSLLTLPGDNGTWSVTVWAASSDTAMRTLRDPEKFTAVVRACPLHAHWLDGEPITGVLTAAGVLDRYHRYVVDGRPVATGVAAVGDAWACTNPSAGRGLTVGLMHAQRLRDVVRDHVGDPGALAQAWDRETEATVSPYYWSQIRADRARMAQMDALREGRPPPPPESRMAALWAASTRDADAFRAALELGVCLALPDEVFARPDVIARVEAVARDGAGMRIPGPDRAALLELLA